MNDVCIRFKDYGRRLNVNFKEYRDWIIENMDKDAYYIPPHNLRIVYFLSEQDLAIFTLRFGHVWEYHVDTSLTKVEKMIVREQALESMEKNNA